VDFEEPPPVLGTRLKEKLRVLTQDFSQTYESEKESITAALKEEGNNLAAIEKSVRTYIKK
jgi:hypothetical protein